jgi:hypothetical protein
MSNDLRLSGSQTVARTESDVRYNYANLNQIIGAANTFGYQNQSQLWSGDGGATWSQTQLPTPSGVTDDRQSDPCVDWTADGTAWALTVGIDDPNLVNKVRSFKSTDAGATWSFDSTVSGNQTGVDKPNLWVDHSASSPHHDNLYSLWWDTDNGATFVSVRQGPGGTWGAPYQVSGHETSGGSDGGDIKTNTFGDVFASWHSEGTLELYMAKSVDGGVTFGNPVKFANTFGALWNWPPAQATRGCLVYVSTAAYRTSTRDEVYACWADLSGDPGCNSESDEPYSATSDCKMRVWFTRSVDGGTHWATPTKINDQAAKNDQFFARLALDETNGVMMVTYYDTINDPNRVTTNIWMQSSNDGGVSWSAATQITSAGTNESATTNPNQRGDYIGLTGHAGQFFACWTDYRNGIEEIWGAPLTLAGPGISFYMEETTFSQDEVNLQLPGTAKFAAGWIAVDGLRPGQLTLTTSNLNNPPSSSLFTTSYQVDPALLSGVQSGIDGMLVGPTFTGPGGVSAGGVVAQDPTLPNLPQRFLFPFLLEFSGATGFVDMVNDNVTSADISLSATLAITAGSYSNQTEIELTTGEDPRFEDVNPQNPLQYPSWLSFDLRFFTMTVPGSGGMVSRFGAHLTGPSDAPGFIAGAIANLTAGTTGSDTFDHLSQDEEGTSALAFNQKDNGGNFVYNFAIARVRLVASSTATAKMVRVFFRLFQAQNTASNFDDGTTYRYWTDGTFNGVKVPLLGVGKDQNGNPEYVTIPCFASTRIHPRTQSMSQQLDTPNAHDLAGTGAEKDYYFGCWIDNNQPTAEVMPAAFPSGSPPPPGQAAAAFDGPWPTPAPLETMLTAFTAFPHQCLIAEIRYDDTPIPPGVTSTFDKLAQRNIAWIDV